MDNDFATFAAFLLGGGITVLALCALSFLRDLRRFWRGKSGGAGRLLDGGCLRRMP